VNTVFQSYALFPHMTVRGNIAFPLRMAGTPAAEAARKIDEALAGVRLAGFDHRFPHELSGGQRQRVAVARALVTDPVIVLADEPTANLDSVTGETIVALMEEINRRDGTTFIFSTHDPRVMGRAHRVLRLADGRIEA
jgi:putative ABC transport system ATP-binding protein